MLKERKADINMALLYNANIKSEAEEFADLLNYDSDLQKRNILIKNLVNEYSVFKWGVFLCRCNNKTIASLAIGFQSPCFLIRVFKKFRISLPLTLCKLLVKFKLLSNYEVASIFVKEEFRGCGLANLLMDFAEQFGKDQLRQDKIVLLVRDTNERAVAFYKRREYKQYSSLQLKDGLKLRMEKSL